MKLLGFVSFIIRGRKLHSLRIGFFCFLAGLGLVLCRANFAQTTSIQPANKRAAPDPMDDTIAGPPPYRMRVDDRTYAIRAATAMKSLPPSSDAPYCGALIDHVGDGSPAAELGLVPGDIICRLDDVPIISESGFIKARQLNLAQAAKVWSQKNENFRTVQMMAGKIGIGVGDYWNVENEYICSLGKGEAPNPDLLIACRSARTDGALAETGLAHANLHTPFSNFIAAAAAYFELRPDDCLTYANAALPQLPAEHRQFAQVLASRSALASFRWAAAKKLGYADSLAFNKKEFANLRLLPAAMDDLKLIPAEPRQVMSDTVALLPFIDHSKDIVTSDPQNGNMYGSQSAAEELVNTGKITFAIPDAHFNAYRLGPGGANIDFHARYQYRPSNDQFGRFDKNLKIELITAGDSREIITFTIYQVDGNAEILGLGLPVCRLNTNQFTGNGQPFSVHITAVGGRCEIDLNDHQIFYGPLNLPEADRQLCFSTMVVGLTGQMDQVSWKTAAARSSHQ